MRKLLTLKGGTTMKDIERSKRLRTFIELDEVCQNIEPRHFFVLRIFGIPIARFNQVERDVVTEEEDD